jgi:transcriptional regulator
MYVPTHFSEADQARIATLMAQHGFVTLVSVVDGEPVVTHAPVQHDPARNVLIGHMARANPHSKALVDGAIVTAIFHGPHAYVSPAWYANPGVPTWNYASVHVKGTIRMQDTLDAKWDIVKNLSAQYETGSGAGTSKIWDAEAHKDRFWKLLEMIVGFEVAITDIQAKFKLSQNRDFRDQQNVIANLEKAANSEARGVAALMSENLAKSN